MENKMMINMIETLKQIAIEEKKESSETRKFEIIEKWLDDKINELNEK